jgi:hypothetical protein
MVAAQVSRGIPYLSANERLKMTFEAWLYASITVAAILHFVVLSLWPSMSVILHPPPRPPIEVIVPPSPTIPPPPVDIPRPAIPVPGDVAVELDPMISALDEAWARVDVPLVANLWGKDARGLKPLLGDTPVVESPHPSPLSARYGFFGSRPFSRANELLVAAGGSPVDWTVARVPV